MKLLFPDLIDVAKAQELMDGYPGAFSQIITNMAVNTVMHAYDSEESVQGRGAAFTIRLPDEHGRTDA